MRPAEARLRFYDVTITLNEPLLAAPESKPNQALQGFGLRKWVEVLKIREKEKLWAKGNDPWK